MLIPLSFRKRTQELASILFDVAGLDVFGQGRCRDNATARMIVSYQLRQEGIPETTVAKLIGKNHATIHYYVEKMDIVLNTPGYTAEREVWKEFKDKVNEHDSAKKSAVEV